MWASRARRAGWVFAVLAGALGGLLAGQPQSAFAADGSGAQVGGPRTIHKSATIAASPAEVWKAWATNEGIKSFFGLDADVELSVGGKFEIYFSLDAPRGSRGSEGCKVLAYLPEKMLAFSWNAPPSIPRLRSSGAQTQVVLEFEKLGARSVRVELTQHGLGTGEDWDKYHAYFDRAWGNVLASLKKRFEPKTGEQAKTSGTDDTAAGGEKKKHWVYFLHPARPGFLEKPTEEEIRILRTHAAYIKRMADEGRVLLAGPCDNPTLYPQNSEKALPLELPTPGIVVFEAADADEARRIMEGDPAVRADVFRARVNLFHLAFSRNSD